jgi:glycosyltransferase involved in cell wall biosynthesis
MKILHVIPNPFYAERGGLIRAYRQIQIAVGQGWECHVACYHLGKELPGATIHRIPWIPWYKNYAPGANMHRFYLDILLLIKTYRLAIKFRPDIIHAHLHEGVFAALPLARRLKVPLLFDAEGSLSEEMATDGFFGAAFFKRIERYLTGQADYILTSSRQLFSVMLDRFFVPPEKIVLFEDHIDTLMFSPRPPSSTYREKLSIPPEAPVVVYIGSLDKLQGMDFLLKTATIIAASVSAVHFLIVGFPDEKAWEDRFKRCGVLNCHFPGKASRIEAVEYLSLGTVGVSAKRSGSSQGNGKLLDYMAMGLPVVAFDGKVNRDILGEWGAFAPENNVDKFSALVLDFIKNPGARRHAGEGLRKRVRDKFSTQAHGAQLLEIYSSIINNASLCTKKPNQS